MLAILISWKSWLIFAFSILPKAICEFLIFAKKSNFFNLIKSLASEILGRSKNFRIESCRGFSCHKFECLFRQIGQLEFEILKNVGTTLKNEKKISNIDITKTIENRKFNLFNRIYELR